MLFTYNNLTNKNIKFSLSTFSTLYNLCDNKKNTLLQSYSNTLRSFNDNHDNNYFINLHNLLSQFRHVLDDINYCIEKTNTIITKCKELQTNIDTENKETYIHSLNTELEENYNEILNKLSTIDIFISDTILKSNQIVPVFTHTIIKEKQINTINTPVLVENTAITISDNIKITEPLTEKKDSASPVQTLESLKKEKKKKTPTVSVFKDFDDNNTLLISDTNKKVFLPYKLTDLKEILEKNPSYSSLEEIIEANYILPINKFTNSTVSRFKEGYTLMKEKEKKTRLSAIELGLELAFNNNLNPAIITACKNLNELDTYLDCLDKNKIENFHCFEIKYDIKPLAKN